MNRLIVSALITAISHPSFAASQNECAIWLCLPAGFSSPQCQPAKTAMLKRMLEFKSPVPSFGSCSADGQSNGMELVITQSALMGATINSQGEYVPPEKRIIPGFCNFRDSGPEEPLGCVATLQTIRVHQNGVQLGDTYHRGRQGSDYTENTVTGEITKIPEIQ